MADFMQIKKNELGSQESACSKVSKKMNIDSTKRFGTPSEFKKRRFSIERENSKEIKQRNASNSPKKIRTKAGVAILFSTKMNSHHGINRRNQAHSPEKVNTSLNSGSRKRTRSSFKVRKRERSPVQKGNSCKSRDSSVQKIHSIQKTQTPKLIFKRKESSFSIFSIRKKVHLQKRDSSKPAK